MKLAIGQRVLLVLPSSLSRHGLGLEIIFRPRHNGHKLMGHIMGIPLLAVNKREWICDCRQLYLTQELDLLCMGAVVLLVKSFIFFFPKTKFAVNPPSI
jgi:hypothetical protein